MSYYWFNRKNLLKKASVKYHKEGGKERASEITKEIKKL